MAAGVRCGRVGRKAERADGGRGAEGPQRGEGEPVPGNVEDVKAGKLRERLEAGRRGAGGDWGRGRRCQAGKEAVLTDLEVLELAGRGTKGAKKRQGLDALQLGGGRELAPARRRGGQKGRICSFTW